VSGGKEEEVAEEQEAEAMTSQRQSMTSSRDPLAVGPERQVSVQRRETSNALSCIPQPMTRIFQTSRSR
jgi:hypothetical protein